MSSPKKNLMVFGLLASMTLFPVFSQAEPAFRPTSDGGNFGIGLEGGGPGTWGISGKLWIDRDNAFQGAVKFPGGSTLLQLDYLWHDFALIHMKSTEGQWPFYVGLGGDLSLDTPAAVAVRIPVGVSYIFDKRNVPVDLYLQLVPALWLTDNTQFKIYGEFGAHYYF